MKNTVVTFRNAKNHENLAMLTAYDYTMAKLMDQSGVNALLVGDSLGMVMLGYESTLAVTMAETSFFMAKRAPMPIQKRLNA